MHAKKIATIMPNTCFFAKIPAEHANFQRITFFYSQGLDCEPVKIFSPYRFFVTGCAGISHCLRNPFCIIRSRRTCSSITAAIRERRTLWVRNRSVCHHETGMRETKRGVKQFSRQRSERPTSRCRVAANPFPSCPKLVRFPSTRDNDSRRAVQSTTANHTTAHDFSHGNRERLEKFAMRPVFFLRSSLPCSAKSPPTPFPRRQSPV